MHQQTLKKGQINTSLQPKDLNADVKILSNRFILSLQKNKEFLTALKKYKIAWDFEPELIKSLFIVLKNSEEYKEYLKKTGDTLHSDKDIIKFIFKKVILKSSLAEQVFEDMFIFWPVDKDVLQALIAKTFKTLLLTLMSKINWPKLPAIGKKTGSL